jgi:thiol-disulfide isomerase/thioredoxin
MWGIIILVVLFLVLFYFLSENNKKNAETYESKKVEDKRIVLYYAPWCHHCENLLKNGWKQLKERNGNDIEIIEYDCDKFKCEGIQGFPTIVLFKENNQITYKGDRSYESLVKFIQS